MIIIINIAVIVVAVVVVSVVDRAQYYLTPVLLMEQRSHKAIFWVTYVRARQATEEK